MRLQAVSAQSVGHAEATLTEISEVLDGGHQSRSREGKALYPASMPVNIALYTPRNTLRYKLRDSPKKNKLNTAM